MLPRYRWFGAYLVFNVCRDLVLANMGDFRGAAYGIAWTITEPIAAVFTVMATYEIFTLIAAHYRNFAETSRRVLLLATLASILLCAFTVSTDFHGANWLRPVQELIFFVKRWVFTICALFLLLAAGFFQYYRVPFRPNVVTHGRLLAAYFTINAVGVLIINWNRWTVLPVNMLIIAGAVVCYILWSLLMTRKGERAPEAEPPDTERQQDLFRRTGHLIDTVRRVKTL